MLEGVYFTAIIVILILVIGIVFARLYQRASKEISFVRTGFGGQKVILNGGALSFPVLHEIIPVNMNTLRLEVKRADEAALITRDRMRVDVTAEFYVRVQPTAEAIANAAQTLGMRTMKPEALKELVEGKFVDALRAVAAEMAMEELHEQRVLFVQKVQTAVSEDLLKNGLELEAVSLTGLDQTNKDYFNPNNAFDAEGLTRLTEEIEERRKKRNDIEQDTQVQIARKNLEAEQQQLEIRKEEEYARLKQDQEVAIRRAEQASQIAREEAQRGKEAEEEKINSALEVKRTAIASEQHVREREIEKSRITEAADIDRKKLIELAEQDRAIAVAEKSRLQSEADAAADEARAIAVKAEEQVQTVRQVETADRQKQVELVEAAKIAERDAMFITIAAEAGKEAAEDEAEAVRIQAHAEAEKSKITAEGDAEARKLRALAEELEYKIEAAGKLAVNEASNTLSAEQIAMQVKLQLIDSLPEIIAESVKPMEQIDGIKIFQVDGLGAAGGSAGGSAGGDSNGAGGGSDSLADQMVNSALRYRGQAPLLDAMLQEIGLDGGNINGLTGIVADD